MAYTNVDRIAEELQFLGKLGYSMPPAWRGAKIIHAVKSPTGGKLGFILPGVGYCPNIDFKELGITHGSLPHVYERTFVNRVNEYLAQSIHRACDNGKLIDNEKASIGIAGLAMAAMGYAVGDASMLPFAIGAITTYDGIINARAGGKANDIWITKNSFTTTANDWYTNARIAGLPGAFTFNSATPPTQASATRATAGALSLGLSDPGGTDKKYLLTFGWISAQQINCGILADLQVQGGSFRLTVTTAETVASPVTIPRTYYSPLGAGNYMWGVTTTGASATATNLTVTYIDQDNNAGNTVVVAGPATATIADQIWPDSSSATGGGPFWALATGDFGVRSMSQTQSSVALVAGVIAVCIGVPLVIMPGIAANSYIERDSTVQVDGLTELVNVTQVIGALTMLVLPNTTSTGVMGAFMRSCSG